MRTNREQRTSPHHATSSPTPAQTIFLQHPSSVIDWWMQPQRPFFPAPKVDKADTPTALARARTRRTMTFVTFRSLPRRVPALVRALKCQLTELLDVRRAAQTISVTTNIREH